MGRAEQVGRKPLEALGSLGRGVGERLCRGPPQVWDTAPGLGPLEPGYLLSNPRGATSQLYHLGPGTFLL